ncbi:MAG: MBL fold metallo-hydrolase [Chloroflexi bacterium]|nr:MBL fold metallo-hydrolase [Chloroflexota bacterium]
MKLFDNLYAYLWPGLTYDDMARFGNNSNSYVIANAYLHNGKRSHIIVDPGHIVNDLGIDCQERLSQEMQRDGLKYGEVGLVVDTHSHRDHCEGSRSFQEKNGAIVAIGELEAEYYDKIGRSRYQHRGGIKVPDLQPDTKLKEGDWKLEGLTLEVMLSPGHTPGHICLYWAEKRTLIVGDVMFYRNTGRTDLPGGSGDQLRQSIERLSQLDVEYVLTGHQYEGPGVISGKAAVKQNFDYVKKQVLPHL